VVGSDDGQMRIPAHIALVAARSQWLRTKIRQAREARDKHLEKVITKISFHSNEQSITFILMSSVRKGVWFFNCTV